MQKGNTGENPEQTRYCNTCSKKLYKPENLQNNIDINNCFRGIKLKIKMVLSIKINSCYFHSSILLKAFYSQRFSIR